MTPEEEAAAAAAAAAKNAAEAIEKLTAEIHGLTRDSNYLRKGFTNLKPEMYTEKFFKGVSSSIYKSMSNAGRAAEEEAVRQAKKRGESELQQDAARAKARFDNDKKSAEAAYKANSVLAGLGKTAGAVGGFAKSLAEGEQGFRALTPIIDAAAAAFSSIPFFGGAVKAAAEASKFMLNQLQNATDAFQDISKVGGLTSKGMSGLQQQFLTSGMQLKSYTKTVTENSAALANFGGSVGKGAERFSDTAGMVQKDFGITLQRLGFGIDEIGEYTASYIARQTTLGLSQNRTNAQLAAGAAGYAKELDLLSKLTGASRKELEAQQNSALSESRFRAQTDEMIANGQEGQAKAMLDFQSLVNKISPELAQGLRDVSTGMINSEAAIKLQNSTAGEGQNIMKRLQDGQIDQVQAYKELQAATKNNIETQRFQARAVGDSNVFVKYAEISKLQNAQMDSMGQVIQTQKEQEAGTDALTNDTVKAQRNMQELSIQMQKLGFTYMPDAAKAVSGFTGALNKLLKLVSEKTGARQLTVGNGEMTPDEAAAAGINAPPAAGNVAARRGAGRRARANANQAADEAALAAGTPAGATPAAGTPAGTPAGATPAANTPVVPRRSTTANTNASPELGAGPVFGRPDDTIVKKIQVTLEDIREDIKKIVKHMGAGGAAGSQATVQSALAEHDHAHGEPGGAVSPEVAAQISAGFVNPLKNMVQTSGMIRNDGKTVHGGIDLGGKIGDAIMAPISGKITRVLEAGKGDGGFGNAVEIEDATTGMKHMLAHMDKSMARVGDTVKAGTQVGTLGSTGQSTGPHLHHEIIDKSGKKIDPTQFYTGVKDTSGRPIAGAGSALGPTQTAGATPGTPGVPGMPEGPIMAKSELKGQQREFYDKLYATLLQEATKAGVKNPEAIARLGAAQSSLETGYGKATAGGNNYFGIKGSGGNQQTTQEFDKSTGKMVTQQASFRKYGSMEESAADYIKMMQGSKRYAGVLGAGSTDEAIAAQGRSGYATDPGYAQKLALITSSATGRGVNLPGGMAGPTSSPTPYAAAPGAIGGLPAAQQQAAAAAPSPPLVASPEGNMLQQLVSLNRDQNTLLARILQTSQA